MYQDKPCGRKRARESDNDGKEIEESKGDSTPAIAHRLAGSRLAAPGASETLVSMRAQEDATYNSVQLVVPVLLGGATPAVNESDAGTFAEAGGVGLAARAVEQSLITANLPNQSQMLSQQQQLQGSDIRTTPFSHFHLAPYNPRAQLLAAFSQLSSPAPASRAVDALGNLTSRSTESESVAFNASVDRPSTNRAPGVFSPLQQASRIEPPNPENAWGASTLLQLSSTFARNPNLLGTPGSMSPYVQSALLNSNLNSRATRSLGSLAYPGACLGQTLLPSRTVPAARSLSLTGLYDRGHAQQFIASSALTGLTSLSQGGFNLRPHHENVLPPPAFLGAPLSLTTYPSLEGSEDVQATSARAQLLASLLVAAPDDQTAAILETVTPDIKEQNELEVGPPAPSDGDSVLLYTPTDDAKISPYQCIARQQLEFFVVGQDDMEAGAQGRNRPIVLGQVGIRCRHCAKIPHRQKQRASTYFPAKLSGVYQTAQNITNSHLCQLCHCIPESVRRKLKLLQSKKSGTGGGRRYWTESAEACGIYELETGGLRLRREGQGTEGGPQAQDKQSLRCSPVV